MKTFKITAFTILNVLLIEQVLLAPMVSSAAIPPTPKHIDLYTIQVVRPNVQPVASNEFLYFKLMPQMTPTDNKEQFTQELRTKLPQKWTDEFLRSGIFRSTSLGKATTKVETAVQPTVTVQERAASPYSYIKPLNHTFNMDLKIWESKARLRYSGYFDSEFVYSNATNTTDLSISKPLNDQTTLALINTSPMGQLETSGRVVLTYTF